MPPVRPWPRVLWPHGGGTSCFRILHLRTSSDFPKHWAIPPMRLHGDLDELATQPPTRDTWDALVFSMPMEGEDPRHQSLLLDYVPRQPVNLEKLLPLLWFRIRSESGELICKTWGLCLEWMIQVYDPIKDEPDWIPIEGCMNNLS